MILLISYTDLEQDLHDFALASPSLKVQGLSYADMYQRVIKIAANTDRTLYWLMVWKR